MDFSVPWFFSLDIEFLRFIPIDSDSSNAFCLVYFILMFAWVTFNLFLPPFTFRLLHFVIIANIAIMKFLVHLSWFLPLNWHTKSLLS